MSEIVEEDFSVECNEYLDKMHDIITEIEARTESDPEMWIKLHKHHKQ